jgi:hypothetical protein
MLQLNKWIIRSGKSTVNTIAGMRSKKPPIQKGHTNNGPYNVAKETKD